MHIGKLIREQVEKQNKSVAWLAGQLSCSCADVHGIYESAAIDTDLLLRISLILHYNFFKYYFEKVESQKRLLSLMDLYGN